MRMNPNPAPAGSWRLAPLAQAEGFGRIRTLMQGPDGALSFTTSNGTNDTASCGSRPPRPPRVAGRQAGLAPSGVTLARTGTQITVFVRSTGDQVSCGAGTDDGGTWGR